MPRCNDTWVRKGMATVEVTVTRPADPPFYSLTVAKVPRSRDMPVEQEVFDSNQLAAGASWQVPAHYECTFTLVSTGNQALSTAIRINGEPAECSAGSHCQGACEPGGSAGLAGHWKLTTWRP